MLLFVLFLHTQDLIGRIPHPHCVGDHDDKEHAQVGRVEDNAQGEQQNMGDDVNQDEWPQDDVPLPSFPTRGGASGSFSHYLLFGSKFWPTKGQCNNN